MMDVVSAVILGIVEGFTEFLPVSSTAHLILASDILGIAQTGFAKTFEIAIQSGAILAVLALYWKKFTEPEALKRIVVAFIPTGVLGFLLYKTVKTHLIGNTEVVLWALALGGLALIAFEYWFKEKEDAGTGSVESISYGQAAGIGLFQALAMIPGVSRSGATIIGGMLSGIKREVIVEFSFLLAVPTMLAATGLDLIKTSFTFTGAELSVLTVGCIVSFVTALISIKWLLSYVRSHSFVSFGIYRIALVAVFLLFFSHTL